MPPGVAILGPEHRPDLEDLLEARAGGADLLVQLGGHGKAGGASEVVEREDVGAALRRAADQLRGVDLGEALVDEDAPEEVPDHALDPENALVRRRSQVEPPVIEPLLHADPVAAGC